MATTTKPKPVAKKAPVKAIAKPVAKPVAKKAAATKAAAPAPTKAELAAAEKAKAAKAAESASKKAAAEKARTERATANETMKAEVARLRSEGNKWPEVASALGISQGKAQLLGAIAEGEAAGVKKPTVALIVKDRDEGKLGWVAIAVKYGLTKAQTQKMYAESGNDPSATYIGRGGRYFSHEAAIADQRAASKAAKTTSAPAKKAPAKKAAAPAKALFTEESTKEEIASRIEGKTVMSTVGVSRKVKAGSVKVGHGKKSGKLAISFTDVKSGGTVTMTVDQIASVTK